MTTLRRTNAGRTRDMRARLLDATVACLAEHGYAGTSTTRICKVAGVSRGAQLHHFPLKQDLMVAAVEHVFEARRADFRAALADVQPGEGRIGEALDRMWDLVQGRPTAAWLELVMAGRTDPELHDRVVGATDRLRAAGAAEFALLGEASGLPPAAMQLASAVMDGLAVQEFAGLTSEVRDGVLTLLKELALPPDPAIGATR